MEGTWRWDAAPRHHSSAVTAMLANISVLACFPSVNFWFSSLQSTSFLVSVGFLTGSSCLVAPILGDEPGIPLSRLQTPPAAAAAP